MEDAPVVLAPPPPPPPPRILTPSTVTTSTFTSVPPASTAVTPSVPTSQTVQPERESWRGGGGGGGGGSRFGLTKEVLSAHTQQEEQAFLDRFKDLSKLRVFDQTASLAARCHVPAALPRGKVAPPPTYVHAPPVRVSVLTAPPLRPQACAALGITPPQEAVAPTDGGGVESG